MPNREELACLICGKYKCILEVNENVCTEMFEAADRVIEAGYKSPEEYDELNKAYLIVCNAYKTFNKSIKGE